MMASLLGLGLSLFSSSGSVAPKSLQLLEPQEPEVLGLEMTRVFDEQFGIVIYIRERQSIKDVHVESRYFS